MFSGIVVAQARVLDNQRQNGGDYSLSLACDLGRGDKPIKSGDSVAVNGVCLTMVERLRTDVLLFDVSAETARCTTLGRLQKDDAVNLELALCMGDRLNGHLVTGHVDCLAMVRSCRQDGRSLRIELEAPSEFMPYLAAKGSVCLDGVSLTIVEVRSAVFTVNVVPYTAGNTHFSSLVPGSLMNLEVDILARYLQRLLRASTAE